jgi:hypothetical protein
LYLDCCFYLFLVLLFDADSELAVAVNQVLLIYSNSQLLGEAVVDQTFSLGVFIREDYFAVQTVFIWYDFVGLALVQSQL